MGDARIGEGVRVLILGSGKAGHEINAIGVAEALGGRYVQRRVDPRKPFLWMSPFGPVDPRDAALFDPPYPDIVIASGRVTMPYLRAFKRKAGSRLFAVFLQDPRFARREMDLIWVPEHDRHRGPNVIATLTSPHPFSARRLAATRAAPDPRLAALPSPRCAIVLGGPSGAQHFTTEDETSMSAAVRAISAQGFFDHGDAVAPHAAEPPRRRAGRAWRRAGLRLGRRRRQSLCVDPGAGRCAAGDRRQRQHGGREVATVTGAPVYVFEPSGGGSTKLTGAIDALERRGAVRRFDGRIERFQYTPIDSSGEIAAEIARRFARMRSGAG